MTKQKRYEFKYEGQNFIDLNTLITSQLNFLTAINLIQAELHPQAKMNVKVGATKEGSFIVDLLLESSWVDQIFNHDNMLILDSVLAGFASLIEIHGFLKGNKPTSVQKNKDNSVTIKIEGDNNEVKIDNSIFNLYQSNQGVSKAIEQNFQLLEDDKEIGGISIKEKSEGGKDKEILKVPRDQFKDLSHESPFRSRETFDELFSKERVFIKKPNLMPEKGRIWKWQFIHKGRDLSANIEDSRFMTKINEGLRIAQGDRLIVDLMVNMKYDEKLHAPIESGRFRITKVHSFEEREEQSKINFD